MIKSFVPFVIDIPREAILKRIISYIFAFVKRLTEKSYVYRKAEKSSRIIADKSKVARVAFRPRYLGGYFLINRRGMRSSQA